MNEFHPFVGKHVEVKISGESYYKGTLIDSGLDILVVYDHRTAAFFYIPIVHIQRVKEVKKEETSTDSLPVETPIESDAASISFRKTLLNAKGKFVQIYVTGNKSIHGYLTSIMNDYFVFYSPVYKTMFISMNHLKCLLPYPQAAVPYSLSNQSLPVNPTSIPLARTFESQCEKLENQIVVLDGGGNDEKVGLLQKVDRNRLTLITADREMVCWNLQHIKTIHVP